MKYNVDATPQGWIVQEGDLAIEAANPFRDKGVIRTVLTVR